MMERRRITLRDVAEAAGVSKTTAVFILNERPNFSVPDETRRRVQDAARRLGYRRNGLAAALSRGKTGSIGIVIAMNSASRGPGIGNEFLLGILMGATRAAAAAGLRLTTIPYAMDGPPSPEDVTDQRVDGLILVAIMNEEYVRAVYATGFPCVTFGSGWAEPGRRVRPDNVGGARLAVEHLIALGHRNIAYCGRHNTESDEERRRGWRETLTAHGLTPAVEENSLDAILQHIETDSPDRPTAVFCHNDARASLLMNAARQRGLSVPGHVSIVGFDDGVVAEAVGLTTIRNPLEEQATVAVDLLMRLAAGEEPEAPAPLPTELIVRHTTAPPGNGAIIAIRSAIPEEVTS
jgi:DNA-binding LacI/PurR family transcriptional regulator